MVLIGSLIREPGGSATSNFVRKRTGLGPGIEKFNRSNSIMTALAGNHTTKINRNHHLSYDCSTYLYAIFAYCKHKMSIKMLT